MKKKKYLVVVSYVLKAEDVDDASYKVSDLVAYGMEETASTGVPPKVKSCHITWPLAL